MARGAFWTILVDDQPTAFRAPVREDLLPTLKQLQRQSPTALIKWFQKGQLWDSPGDAMDAAKPPRQKAGWRPGGAHVDPRDKYKLPRDVKRKRWADQAKDGRGPFMKTPPRPDGGGSGPAWQTRPRADRPPPGGRPPVGGGPARPERDARPRQEWRPDRPAGPGANRPGATRPGANRPRTDRPRDDRPREDRARADRPRDDRPRVEARPDRETRPRSDTRPPLDRRGPAPGTKGAWSTRPPGVERPRSTDRRPPGDARERDVKPRGESRPERDARPRSETRPAPDRRGPAPAAKGAWSTRPPSGADRQPRRDGGDRPAGREGSSSRPPASGRPPYSRDTRGSGKPPGKPRGEWVGAPPRSATPPPRSEAPRPPAKPKGRTWRAGELPPADRKKRRDDE